MSIKTFEINIPVDEDGFLEMECDFCKNRFMISSEVYKNESYLHFFCPNFEIFSSNLAQIIDI